MVSLKSSRWSNYTQYGAILQKKKNVLLSNVFPSINMFFIKKPKQKQKQKIGGHRARLIEKEHFFRYRAFLRFCTRTRSCARANDAKIVRSKDAQCNTKE